MSYKNIVLALCGRGDEGKVIKEAASGANMLILGHRKRSAFKDQFFDSVDEGIVNRVECPVLVVPKD